MRTPLLSLDFYKNLTSSTVLKLEDYKEIWKNTTIQEAIFLASPELFDTIEKWLQGHIKDPKKTQRLQASLLKYLSRMSSRCTPFGLFAGCSIGTFGASTDIQIEPYQKHQRQTRFDMNFLVAFSQKLSKTPEIQKQLSWFPNNSLYKIGNQYRYVEYIYNDKNKREHSIEAVTHTPYLEVILEHAKSGKKINDLATLLVDDDITLEDATAFIETLIQNQLLVSEIEPSVTGNDFLSQLLMSLQKIEGTKEIVSDIRQYQKFLDQIDQQLGNTAQHYIDLSTALKKLETSFELKYLFQTDLYTQATINQLDQRVGYQIKRAMTLLNKISLPPQNSNLKRFKNAFRKRYETREIPLATALDTEIGIGYLQNQEAVDSTPFLDGLHVPYKPDTTQNLNWGPAHEVLSKKLQEISKNNGYMLVLEDADFEKLEVNWNDLPDTMSTMVEILASDPQEKIVLSNIGGSSAATLLGRFSTGSPEILEHVQNIVATEQQIHPDKLLAEIVHLPESRTGNVIRRADIRAYEIPYLGKSNLPQAQQIPIQDLMLSVKNDTLILRSKKHDKIIVPRLTNAHNYGGRNALPIYHFLCDLQRQNIRSGIGFDWGETLEKNSFLPRVTYKNFIFSKARWRIAKKDIQHLLDADPTTKSFVETVTKWRTLLQIPKEVQLIDRDNTLLIDLTHQDTIMMWLQTVKKREYFMLEEFLFTEHSIVQQGKNKLANQFVIAFYNQQKLTHSKNNDVISKGNALAGVTVAT